MIKNIPSMESITEKVMDLINEHIETKAPLVTDKPLAAEMGFDSLDLIETSFSLQEFFGFEFSDKNAIEELNTALGDDSVIREGVLTEFGREMVRKRMPELKEIELPKDLTAMQLQMYYTVETFARLILEFYRAAPETCPETGEPVSVADFKIVTEESRQEVKIPTGDELIDRWVAETAPALES